LVNPRNRDPNDEQGGDRHDVDDHQPLQDERVGDRGHAVQADQTGDAGRDRERDPDRDDRQDDRRDPGERLGELSARDRAMPLLRMAPVQRGVAKVVGEVAGAGDRAEGDERDQRVDDLGTLVQLLREEQAGEHQQVLDPLRWPHGDQ
jgi:hypothetical protein